VAIPHERIPYAGIGEGRCQLTFMMSGDDGDMVEVGAILPRPIRPDVYPAEASGRNAFQVTAQPRCDRPGVLCPWRGDYGSGTVELTRVGPDRIDGSVSVAMTHQNKPLHLSGSFTAVPMGVGGFAVSSGRGSCFSSGVLAVESVTPLPDAVNVDFDDAEVLVELSEPYDPASLGDASFRLEYRLPDGPGGAQRFATVAGAIERTGERSFRFVPAAPLLDGVVYRATVRGGEQGVLGAAGERMEEDQAWNF
jgi:hypothetical protein